MANPAGPGAQILMGILGLQCDKPANTIRGPEVGEGVQSWLRWGLNN
jgi:hypothetical protein